MQQHHGAVAEAMVCLQAQQVAGLPDAAEGRHIQVTTTTCCSPAAAAVCRAGVADFHHQLLLLHCAPINSIHAVAVTVTMLCRNDHHHAIASAVNVDLAEQLRRRPSSPSPSVLSFVLHVSGGTAAATAVVGGGAVPVLSLTLHHRLLVTTAGTRTGCSLLRSCLRLPLSGDHGCCPPVLRTTTTKLQEDRRQHQGPAAEATDDDGDGDSSSSGFITIEKGTISRRRPPSDYLLTTDDDDDDEVDGKRPPEPPTTTATCCWSLLDDDTKVENDFLAMLMLEEEDDDFLVEQLDLGALIKDAEADLAAIWPSRGSSRRGDPSYQLVSS